MLKRGETGLVYDGSIKIDTKVDTAGIKQGIRNITNICKAGLGTATAAVGAVSAAITAAGTAAVVSGIKYESAFAGVKKTVNATDAELDNLSKSLLNMSKEIPQSASSLAEIAEAAGQLGIKTDNIADFTEVMANLGVATNMSSTEAATALARLANITGMPQKEFGRLGSTIVALGNNLATTESEITDMSLRIAGAGKQIGMTESDILGFAAALSSVGLESEAGGTAVSTLISKMSLAVAKGGEKLEQFAKVAGLSADEFKTSFEEDATGAIQTFIVGLGKINKDGGSAIETLDNMGLSDIRIRDALLRASGASDTFTQALQIGAEAWEENTALAKEAEQRYQTLESKIQLLKNGVDVLAIAFKDSMDAKLGTAVDAGIGYVNQLTDAFNSGGLEAAAAEAGNIFADIATNVASEAPAMINAAVLFIQNFTKGISNNKTALLNAAKNITKTLVNGLADLLPKEVKKPVKECVKAIETSFKSGGLKTTITAVSNVIKSIGTAATNLSKILLPFATGTIDFLAGNFKTLTTAIIVCVAATKTFQIISTVTELVKSATAAQWLYNFALSANPIVLATAALAGLAAGLVWLCMQTQQTVSVTELLEQSEERLAETQTRLAETMAGVFEAATNYQQQIDGAKGSIDGLSSSVVITAEAQQQLSDKTQEVQNEITLIAQNAKNSRAQLTEDEISRLDDLFTKQKELADKQLEINEAYQEVVKGQAEDLAANNDISEAEYAAYSANISKSAEDTRNNTVQSAEDQRTNVLAEKRALIGTDSKYTEEWYAQQREDANKNYEAAVEEANKLCGDTLSIIEEGYAKKISADDDLKLKTEERNKKIEDENKRHAEEIDDINDKIAAAWDNSGEYETYAEYCDRVKDLEDQRIIAATKHNDNLSKINTEYTDDFEKLNNEQLSTWVAMVSNAELYGGELSDGSKSTATQFLAAIDGLPDESKKTMENTVNGMLESLENKDNVMYAKAKEIADSFIAGLNDRFDIHSPSREMKKIFGLVIEGGIVGTDKATPSLVNQGKNTATAFLTSMRKKLSDNALAVRLRSAVESTQLEAGNKMTSAINHTVALQSAAAQPQKVVAAGNINTTLNIDGREFAVATTPYISEELDFNS